MTKVSKATREQIERLCSEINANIEQLVEVFTDLRDGLQEKFDNHSEAWQEGEKGEAMQEEIDGLESTLENLSYAAEYIEHAEDDIY